MRRAIFVLGTVGGIVIGLGSAAWVLATGMLGPNDGLDCEARGMRGHSVLDHFGGEMEGHAGSPDAEIQRSDVWSFYDIPKSAWHLEPGIDTPQNGIIRVEPLDATPWDRAEYLVYVNGSGVLRATVEPLGDRYVVSGVTTC